MEVNKEELQRRSLNILCFLNAALVFGHEVGHITSTALCMYSFCAGVFLALSGPRGFC